jgi:hypothetical protein
VGLDPHKFHCTLKPRGVPICAPHGLARTSHSCEEAADEHDTGRADGRFDQDRQFRANRFRFMSGSAGRLVSSTGVRDSAFRGTDGGWGVR